MADHSLAPRQPVGLHAWFARFSDRRLVQLAARGSTPAFATIYRRHRGEIYRYCRSLLGNDDDAGDALQNTMLRALRGLEGERREIALRPWLFRIAHNEAISLMRVRGRTTGLASLDVAGLTESDDFETRERLEALIADIGELSEHQRSALIMRELSGLEFDEIAGALGTTPEAAKQAVYSARIALGELADGREMSCDEIRRKVSAEDRRILRARRVRAHLRACRECREFERAIADRSGSLGAFAPALAVPGAKAALEGTAPAPEGTPSGHGGTPPVQAGGPPG
jgi:RNA polymerase sigma factor (sigma-70 family)